MAGPVMLLTPSRGLGGGIERYVATLEWAFAAEGVEFSRVDLQGSGQPRICDCWRRRVSSCSQACGRRALSLRTRHCYQPRRCSPEGLPGAASRSCAMESNSGVPTGLGSRSRAT